MTQSTSDSSTTTSMPRSLSILLTAGAFIVVMAGMRSMASTIAPIFLALTLVITAHPLRGWLMRRRIPGWAATVAVLAALYAVLIGLVIMLVYALARLVTVLPHYSAKFDSLYQSILNRLNDFGVGTDQINDSLSNVDYSSVLSYVQTVASTAFSAGSVFVLILTVLIFMLIDAPSTHDRLAVIDRVRPHLSESLRAFASNIRSYWLVTTVFGAIVAVLDGIALLILGVPLAFTWAVLAFITNYIPNVGFVIGLFPAALLAYLDGGLGSAIAVVVIYAVLNFVIQTILQPRITGDATGVSSLVAFLSLLFWTLILGPIGSLIALPMTLFFKAILIDADPNARWANVFLSDTSDDPLAP